MIAALALLVASRVGRAEEPASLAQGAVIVVTFDDGSVDQGPVEAAVKAHLSDLPVRVVVKAAPRSQSSGEGMSRAALLARASGALGTFSIEITETSDLLVFFTEPDGNAALIRRLPRGTQGVGVTLEQAAIVVRSLVEALLAGERIGMTREPDTSTSHSEPALAKSRSRSEPARDFSDETRPPARTPWTAAVTAAYAGTVFASGAAWNSGATLGFRWHALPPFYASARYTYFPVLEASQGSIVASVVRHPLELMVGYVGTQRFAGNAELGLTLDYCTRRTQVTGEDFRSTPDSERLLLAVSVRGGASWSIAPPLQLALRGGADLLLTRFAYVVPNGEKLLTPNAVRPRLDLELAVSLW